MITCIIIYYGCKATSRLRLPFWIRRLSSDFKELHKNWRFSINTPFFSYALKATWVVCIKVAFFPELIAYQVLEAQRSEQDECWSVWHISEPFFMTLFLTLFTELPNYSKRPLSSWDKRHHLFCRQWRECGHYLWKIYSKWWHWKVQYMKMIGVYSWLAAQLGEHWSAEQEVAGSNPGRTNTRVFKWLSQESAAFVMTSANG